MVIAVPPSSTEQKDQETAVPLLPADLHAPAGNATPVNEVPSDLSALIAALHHLDQLLETAVNEKQQAEVDTSSTPFRGLYVDETEVRRLLAQVPGEPRFHLQQRAETLELPSEEAPLIRLIKTFELSQFDVDLLILALAPEFDLRYERLYAFLQDDVTRKHPSIDLALNLFCATAEEKLERRSNFDPDAPLFRNHLLKAQADPNHTSPPLLSHFLKLPSQITRFLLGQRALDPELSGWCELIEPPLDFKIATVTPEVQGAMSLLLDYVRAAEPKEPLRFYFRGAPDSGKRQAALTMAATAKATLLICSVSALTESSEFVDRLDYLLREATLRGVLLYLSGMDSVWVEAQFQHRETLLRKLRDYPGPLILAGNRPSMGSPGFATVTLTFGVLDFEERRILWQSKTQGLGLQLTAEDLDLLAGQFRLTAAQIDTAAAAARSGSRWREAMVDANHSPEPLGLDDLYTAAREQCGHQLATLTKRIHARQKWDDIVLPVEQVTQLRDICGQAKYRHLVFGDWGFERKLSFGKGLNILFYGPPGTGKTMAAEVIAYELRLDLYRIDLSQIVSKYIGDTEKNLDKIFGAAENSNAILFFDEADALFGKRSEIRDSHDRFANIEVSYLLQKMEEYEGISILATNLRQNLDDAFVRRLQIIVEFPFPDEQYRERIWNLAFPSEAPLKDDVRFDLIAREVRLAGGNIKNIALGAAFLAAADGGRIGMSHLAQAARREHQKMGRAWNGANFARTGEEVSR